MKYIEVCFPKNDILPYVLGELGYESFIEDGDKLLAYIQEKDFNEEVLHNSDFEDARNFTWKRAEYKDWNEEWESQGFEPIVINKNLIIHDLIHPLDLGTNYKYNIVIDAHLAFGTGTHDTTQMMVEQMMGNVVKIQQTGCRVLDCGCGTGILSIVAAKLGASEVVGYDIDEWSVENSIHNARLNNVGNCRFVQGNASVLGREICGGFDIILANINRNILISDVVMFQKIMNAGCILFISGFYCSDEEIITREFGKHNLMLTEQKLSSNNWQCLAFREKPLTK
ncbi:MAG: 50S ribosomal protein L11 methyltransferase [Prevotellaceae bacterium]|nr:50S ribosomal protein L11 methyltransferase [Prevotellaceae bacterium]